jgi:hypothetical protein
LLEDVVMFWGLVEDAQKGSTLQPITKPKSKLDKELQEWEVESTKGGANDGGGIREKKNGAHLIEVRKGERR